MQNKYVGDIGDFGKYGLLRALTDKIPMLESQENSPGNSPGNSPENYREEPLGLGVVWYLTPNAGKQNDGQHTGYLPGYLRENNRLGRQLQKCDPELHEKLGLIIRQERRCVAEIPAEEILPQGTRYHPDLLDFRSVERERGRSIADVRKQARNAWQEAALEQTQDCGLIFLDPDNGLETGNIAPGELRANRHAFYQELHAYLVRGQSLVVHHHLNRSQRALRQIYQKQREVYEKFRMRSFAMRFHRGSPRIFLVIPQRKHRDYAAQRARAMLQGPWGRHFSMIG